ncbi:MAG: PAS domain-containing sensor histidine kinase, partial [Betaproteobacteria bacterium]|nr:PAS domain-containing sensor histidine kinase [Betaproteobacteria bacterium]
MVLRYGRSLKLPPMNSRTTRWLMGLGLSAMVMIGLGLLVLLTRATGNLAQYEENYDHLLWVNIVVAAALLCTIVWGSLRLLVRWRRGQFGARLLVKLAAIFALVGVVPGVLIYTVSYQFVSRSIESWFDLKVEGALAAGLTLGRVTLDTLSHDLTLKTRQASTQLAEVSEVGTGVALEKLREQLGSSDALLWTGAGRLLASAGGSRFMLQPDKPTAARVRQARSQGAVSWIEGLDDSAPGR